MDLYGQPEVKASKSDKRLRQCVSQDWSGASLFLPFRGQIIRCRDNPLGAKQYLMVILSQLQQS